MTRRRRRRLEEKAVFAELQYFSTCERARRKAVCFHSAESGGYKRAKSFKSVFFWHSADEKTIRAGLFEFKPQGGKAESLSQQAQQTYM